MAYSVEELRAIQAQKRTRDPRKDAKRAWGAAQRRAAKKEEKAIAGLHAGGLHCFKIRLGPQSKRSGRKRPTVAEEVDHLASDQKDKPLKLCRGSLLGERSPEQLEAALEASARQSAHGDALRGLWSTAHYIQEQSDGERLFLRASAMAVE